MLNVLIFKLYAVFELLRRVQRFDPLKSQALYLVALLLDVLVDFVLFLIFHHLLLKERLKEPVLVFLIFVAATTPKCFVNEGKEGTDRQVREFRFLLLLSQVTK